MKLNKYLTVSVAGIVAATMVGCSKDDGMVEQVYKDGSWVSKEEATETHQENNYVQSVGGQEEQKGYELINSLLINDERLTVTVMGKVDGVLGPEIWFEVENHKDYPITIQCQDISVNGYMQHPTMSINVSAGMKAKDRMLFSSINSISELTNIKGKLWLINNGDVRDSGTYDIVIN